MDDDGVEVYEVERILLHDYKGRNKRDLYYLIKWSGYDESDATWEKASYIRSLPGLRGIVREYHKSCL